MRQPQIPDFTPFLLDWAVLFAVCISALTLITVHDKEEEAKIELNVLMIIVLTSAFLFLNPFWNHNAGVNGLVGRIDFTIFLFVSVALSVLLSVAGRKRKIIAYASAVLCFGVSAFHLKDEMPVGLRKQFIQRRETLIGRLPTLRGQICEKALILARHGDQFVVSSVVELPSQHTPPEKDNFECLYWLIDEGGNHRMIEDSEVRSRFATLTNKERQAWVNENPHLRELLF